MVKEGEGLQGKGYPQVTFCGTHLGYKSQLLNSFSGCAISLEDKFSNINHCKTINPFNLQAAESGNMSFFKTNFLSG